MLVHEYARGRYGPCRLYVVHNRSTLMELKGSQQYPEGFGQAVADLYTRARTQKHPHSDTNPLEELTIFPDKDLQNHDSWPDAELNELPDYCNCL